MALQEERRIRAPTRGAPRCRLCRCGVPRPATGSDRTEDTQRSRGFRVYGSSRWCRELSPGPYPADVIRYVVADDDASVRAVVRVSAQIEGDFDLVGEAANGDQALALIRATHPDVAVVDIGMPGLGGDTVAAMLKAERSPTKIILYSGRDLPRLPSGVAVALLKDGDIDLLLASMRRLSR